MFLAAGSRPGTEKPGATLEARAGPRGSQAAPLRLPALRVPSFPARATVNPLTASIPNPEHRATARLRLCLAYPQPIV